MRVAARVALAVAIAPLVVAGTGWWTLALIYAAPGPPWVRGCLAAAYVLATGFILVRVRPLWRALAAWAATFLVLIAWWMTIRPSNDREWAPEVARQTRVEVAGDILTFRNVRNFDYRTETDFDERWEDRTVDLARLSALDLFMSYWGSPAIAHTILSWNFEDGPPIAISIETRKQVGQQYSAIAGFFKQYELVYVVADERDVVRLRTSFRGEEVYLYRFDVPIRRARALLLDYVDSINGLVREPKFYNALTDNCTTSIRWHVDHVDAQAPPFDWRMLVNGYGDEMLYERRRIDTSLPFAELRERSRIDETARGTEQAHDFSARIREGLVVPPPRSDR